MIMDLTKLIFKREQLRLALANVTECFKDAYRYNYGCEGDCSGTGQGGCDDSCYGCCSDTCAGDCYGICEGNCEGNCVEQCDGGAGY